MTAAAVGQRLSGPAPAARKKRGRPAQADSAATRTRLVQAAREAFAVKGFDGTSIGAVTGAVGLATSAFYHYFPDKESLYEAVFVETASQLWTFLTERSSGQETAAAAITELVRATDEASEQLPFFGQFLGAVPVEAARNPSFADLQTQRHELQRGAFEAISELALRTGEMPPPPPGVDLAEELRALVVGWLAERQRQAPERRATVPGLLALLRLSPPSADTRSDTA